MLSENSKPKTRSEKVWKKIWQSIKKLKTVKYNLQSTYILLEVQSITKA